MVSGLPGHVLGNGCLLILQFQLTFWEQKSISNDYADGAHPESGYVYIAWAGEYENVYVW